MKSPTRHPSRDELEGFYQGRLDAVASRTVVRHLLEGCASCKEASSRLWAANLRVSSQPAREQSDYDAVFQRAASRASATAARIELERREAPGRFKELTRHPTERQELLLRNSSRYQSYGFCELLLEEAFEEGFREPARSVALARLGVALSTLIPAQRYGGRILADLQARAWGILGNALRHASELDASEDALARAAGLLENGTGDPVEEARLLGFRATLHSVRQRFHKALELHARMISIYRSLGDQHMVGRTLSQKAFAYAGLEENERAIALWQRALENLDPAREPRASQVARHSLAVSYVESGQLTDAAAALAVLRAEYVANGNTVDLLRCDWTIGKLRAAEGRATEAEDLFAEVRDAFVEMEIPIDAALVSLDLAHALFDQGKIGEMRRRLTEAIPILRGLGIHREAIAALRFLERTAELDQVSGAVIRATARFVEEVRNNPDLVFEAPALASQA